MKQSSTHVIGILMIHDECSGEGFISYYASHDHGGVVKATVVWL